MDCRVSLLLALGLMLSSLGCVTSPPKKTTSFAESMPAPLGKQVAETPPPAPPPPAKPAPPDKNKPKKTPKAATCVAGANLQLGEAANPKLTPVQKDEMYERARKGFQQALEIDPTCVDAYLGMARLYCYMGQQDKAVAIYQAGLQKQPKSAELWFQLGVQHARTKDWAPALQCLRKASELAPDNRSCTNTLGLCLAVTGRQDEALEVLSKSVGQAQGHFWMARLSLYLNQVEMGKQHLRLALQADPNLMAARDLLAELEAPPTPAAPPRRGIVDLGFEAL